MSEIWSLSFLYKFIQFGIVGCSGLFIDFGFTYICKEILKIQKYVSNAIGFTLAASSNYVLNRVWTFKSTDPEIFVEYSEFIIISLIGLGINTLILWIIVTKFKLNFYLSKVFAIAIVTVWNFLANAFITFS